MTTNVAAQQPQELGCVPEPQKGVANTTGPEQTLQELRNRYVVVEISTPLEGEKAKSITWRAGEFSVMQLG
jgi:hypothetical protein